MLFSIVFPVLLPLGLPVLLPLWFLVIFSLWVPGDISLGILVIFSSVFTITVSPGYYIFVHGEVYS